MPPSDDDNALSGDEDEEESPAKEHVARVRPGAAKKALGRAAGSKRVTVVRTLGITGFKGDTSAPQAADRGSFVNRGESSSLSGDRSS